jgi:glycosyltransferase involved in cell wall biosynthesis
MTNVIKPKVSVCIPVFNGENYLHDCIHSVLKQNYDNFEILIMDNCSTDSTQMIVSEIQDNRIRYIRNDKNIGVFNNFSKCLAEAHGEYFILLPHDDLLLPGLISAYATELEDKSIGLVYSAVEIIDAEGRLLSTRVSHKENIKFNSEEAIEDIFRNFMPIQLAMVRTSILRNVGGFDSNYGLFIDIHLWLKVFFDGWGCFFLTTPYSAHRSHEAQGQVAFLQLELDVLSDHWAKKLDKQFWKKNSFNIFCLKLMQFADSELIKKNIINNNVSNLMLDIFIRSHLRFLVRSASRLKGIIFWQEILLFKAVKKSYGLLRIINRYPFILFSEIQKKVKKK